MPDWIQRFGIPPVMAIEPCLRCGKPETSRVILVCGDAGWHAGVLCTTGMSAERASLLVSERWQDVYDMHRNVHAICAEHGHPEWAPLPDKDDVEAVTNLKAPLTWRLCRTCAEKSEPKLHTMEAKRLNALLHDDDDKVMIPHVVMQSD